MGARRKSRECALQVLFQADLNQEDAAGEEFFEHHRVSGRVKEFAEHLVGGVGSHSKTIDRVISDHSERWPIARMGAVDRNVLRIAVFELLYDRHTPPKVVIDEAIEIAKKFGSSESHAFINGVLDAILTGIAQRKIVCGENE